MIVISALKGAVISLVFIIPVWWLPVLLQRVIPGFWLAALAVLPVLFGGYAAASKSSRPLLTGMIAGLFAMSFVSNFALSTGELWLAPVVIIVGGAVGALGAQIAVSTGRAAT